MNTDLLHVNFSDSLQHKKHSSYLNFILISVYQILHVVVRGTCLNMDIPSILFLVINLAIA